MVFINRQGSRQCAEPSPFVQLHRRIKETVYPWLGRHKKGEAEYLSLAARTPAFLKNFIGSSKPDKIFLFASQGYLMELECLYAKALEEMGYRPLALIQYKPHIAKSLRLFGVTPVCYEDFSSFSTPCVKKKFTAEATALLESEPPRSVLSLTRHGIQVGQAAAASHLRKTRGNRCNLSDADERLAFADSLAHSLWAADVSANILESLRPDLLLFNDRVYTPSAHLFELGVLRGTPVVTRNAAHVSGSEIVKRFTTQKSLSTHPHSLSKKSWEWALGEMPWTPDKWESVRSELEAAYVSGDWFSEVGTQFNKRIYNRADLGEKLQIPTGKKVAVLFAHMFWDGTFCYGKDIFQDYCDWFTEVLKVAAKNDRVHWLIKIHPANAVKASRDGFKGEFSEWAAIRETLGSLPAHIQVIPTESDICTYSLLNTIDYCLTVRGTIGIECAAFGITTLTAGTGRYDRLGFTHDFASPPEYLAALAKLETIPPMAAQQVELARRFAYALFCLRPLPMDCMEWTVAHDEKATQSLHWKTQTREQFEASDSVRKIRSFIASGYEDWLDKGRSL